MDLREKIEAALRESYDPDGTGQMADAVMSVLQEQEPMVTKRKSGLVLHAGWDHLPVGAKLYAAPVPPSVPDFADAYQGAREEVAIWKKRALEAEALNRKFMAEINGPTYMGEPVGWIYQNANTDTEYLVWEKQTGGRNWRPLYLRAK